MQKLTVKLKYCYGIKSLEHDFDFSKRRAHVIYAPNGSMKSSFARTFGDMKNAKDLVNPKNVTECIISDETGKPVTQENIFVIHPTNYTRKYNSDEEQSSLLVEKKLQEEHSRLLVGLEKQKKEFFKAIAPYTGSPQKIIEFFTSDYGRSQKNVFECLENISDQVNSGDHPDYSSIEYSEIFNLQVIKFLEKGDTIKKIDEYVEKHNELVEKSPYLKKGAFDYDSAEDLCNSLNKSGFFKADHRVQLKEKKEAGDENLKTVNSAEELKGILQKEVERILSDKDLQKRFNAFNDLISNKELKTFRNIIQSKRELIPLLTDIANLKKKFWISYFRKEAKAFNKLLQLYKTSKGRIIQLEDAARNQFTAWQEVVKIFRERFDVPFEISISNQEDVILYRMPPKRKFIHADSGEEKEINEDIILDTLSTGEQRALYLLNVIFEIEARKFDPMTLLIIDDIADSFDYKNKYAIVEYLKDILDTESFRAIILTHNFDFYRTLESRLEVSKHDSCHVVIKTETEVRLESAKKCLDLFPAWKKTINAAHLPMAERQKMLIAAIPFVRNLIEYTVGRAHADYQTLTKIMHIKPDSNTITVSKLKELYNSFWKTELTPEAYDDQSVVDLIFNLADICQSDPQNINFENKIILSIAIRLKAEEYVISKVDPTYVQQLKKEQTAKLIGEYKRQYKNSPNIKILDKVNIMTPENIHFNSFMYEPILDMSDTHLIALYNSTKALV